MPLEVGAWATSTSTLETEADHIVTLERVREVRGVSREGGWLLGKGGGKFRSVCPDDSRRDGRQATIVRITRTDDESAPVNLARPAVPAGRETRSRATDRAYKRVDLCLTSLRRLDDSDIIIRKEDVMVIRIFAMILNSINRTCIVIFNILFWTEKSFALHQIRVLLVGPQTVRIRR